MPSNMLAIDTNFPTFTGEEPVEEVLRELLNYMFQLRESLQYSLQNLSADNFNTIALNNITDGVKDEINQQLQKLGMELGLLQQQVRAIEGRLAGVDALSGKVDSNTVRIEDLENRTMGAEKDLTAIQIWSTDQERRMQEMEDRARNTDEELAELHTVTGNQQQRIGALAELADAVDADVALLQGVVQVGADGSATVGTAEKELRLVGKIYINGQLIEGGTA